MSKTPSGLQKLNLTAFQQLLDDDTSYLYFDREISRQYENRDAFDAVRDILIRIVVVTLLAIAFLGFVAFLVCTIKLLFRAIHLEWLISLIIYGLVVGCWALVYMFWGAGGRTQMFCGNLLLLIKARRAKGKAAISVTSFTNIAVFRWISEGRSSLKAFQMGLAFIVISLWLILFQDIDFSTFFRFIMWGLIVFADSLTLTLFDLVGRVDLSLNTSPYIIVPLQFVILIFAASNLFEVHVVGIRGYKYISGNKFAARGDFGFLVQQMGLFRSPEAMRSEARFAEVSTDDAPHAHPAPLTLSQLDEKILEQGHAILDDAERYLQENGQFTPAFVAAMEEII
ncbi:MAG: hypothetical protein MRY74_10160 [Neomegalonema sp.]|nr:hypothetical protein [Neomegalonema sp.]